MRTFLLALCFISFIACDNQKQSQQQETEKTKVLDIEAELASIEETRTAFQLAVKENRFGDLKKYGTSDVKSLTPDCGSWEPFKTIRENPSGKFHYDSLVMRPVETIIVSDSVAYDFGTSSTYYTNEEGTPIELTATFLAVLKKDKKDGKWKLHREVANTRDLE
ncbi:MAG: hypothetical protein CMC74_11130 [Flavobacteriaceae bacterium]|mgnify:FL=1|nr:hypothetical protein [Flavobacteriaceae bacterium]|tara:strand:+ start:52 stop:543 length:492 start_codon:yes stop_codon:yes gene_type:complete